jgi:hypothetical protein
VAQNSYVPVWHPLRARATYNSAPIFQGHPVAWILLPSVDTALLHYQFVVDGRGKKTDSQWVFVSLQFFF